MSSSKRKKKKKKLTLADYKRLGTILDKADPKRGFNVTDEYKKKEKEFWEKEAEKGHVSRSMAQYAIDNHIPAYLSESPTLPPMGRVLLEKQWMELVRKGVVSEEDAKFASAHGLLPAVTGGAQVTLDETSHALDEFLDPNLDPFEKNKLGVTRRTAMEIDKLRDITDKDQIRDFLRTDLQDEIQTTAQKLSNDVNINALIRASYKELADTYISNLDRAATPDEVNQIKQDVIDTILDMRRRLIGFEDAQKAEAERRMQEIQEERERVKAEQEEARQEAIRERKESGWQSIDDMTSVAKAIMENHPEFATQEYIDEHHIIESGAGEFPLLTDIKHVKANEHDYKDCMIFRVNGELVYQEARFDEREKKFVGTGSFFKRNEKTHHLDPYAGPALSADDLKENKILMVDQANFIRWVRDRINFLDNETPDDPINFYSHITVESSRLFREFNLGMMIGKPGTYFRDGDGEILNELRESLVQLLWIGGTDRNMYVTLMQGDNISNDENIGKVFAQLFASDVWAKDYNGKNTLEYLLTEDEQYGTGDMKVGRARLGSYMLYHNFTDVVELDKLFNQDGKFELYRRDVMWQALKRAAKNEFKKEEDELTPEDILYYAHRADVQIGGMYVYNDQEKRMEFREGELVHDENGDFVRDRDGKFIFKKKGQKYQVNANYEFTSAPKSWYDSNGIASRAEVQSGGKGTGHTHLDDMLKTLNIFASPTVNGRTMTTTRELVSLTMGMRSGLLADVTLSEREREQLRERGELGKYDYASSEFAEKFAFFMTYWMGAADNQDVSVAAWDSLTKLTKTLLYFKKLQDDDNRSRAGGVGNVKKASLNRMYVSTPATGILMEDGESTFYSIMREMVIAEQKGRLRGESTSQIASSMASIASNKMRVARRNVRQYSSQHLSNEVKRYQMQISGKEVRFDKFVSYGPFGEIKYDTSAMISEVQESIIKPTRYGLSTWRRNYAQEERELIDNEKGYPTWVSKTLAEKQFNPQILQAAEKIYLNEMKRNGKPATPFLDSSGRVKRLPNGELDPKAKDALQASLFGYSVTRASIMLELAAMLESHTALGGDYEHLGFITREQIIRGIAKIPAGMAIDDGDFRNSKVTARYLNDFEINLLRKYAKNELWRNVSTGMLGDVGKGLLSGFGSAFGGMFKRIFS